ncbi:hypothetical protein HYFRA_00013391 [Hymenoscyphus fraxineus]|uniref:Ricin B lectin n=1 Tax=Hymenoscyphus fraxineus TaxID=746836 RepID=A0A9N9L9S5_9HELO|nr:hypothetical protein HYFRA_00013391 [Hymenoscyphus fraxineus]
MKITSTMLVAALAGLSSARITYTISKAANPTADQTDAYNKITAAMDAAIKRHESLGSTATKKITVEYSPGTPTADGSSDGRIRFGSGREFMTERTALHEIAHTLGVGTTAKFNDNCKTGNWPAANPVLKGFDGANAKFSCGGGHFWPYGLNFESEMSATAADHHVMIINAMIKDGISP